MNRVKTGFVGVVAWGLIATGVAACSSTPTVVDGAADGSDAIAVDGSTLDALDASAHDVTADSVDAIAVDSPDVIVADVSDVVTVDVPRTDATDSSTGRVPMFHRTSDSACTTVAPAGNCSLGPGIGACSMDGDCTTGTNGRCVESIGGARFCRCSYDTCAHDTDCPTGQLCACHGSTYLNGGNACFPGDCRVDGDCGAGGYCSPSQSTTGCGGLGGYYCHTAADTCIDDGDCTGGGIQMCAYSTTSHHWECSARLLCP